MVEVVAALAVLVGSTLAAVVLLAFKKMETHQLVLALLTQ
jgi:hypothetical protein